MSESSRCPQCGEPLTEGDLACPRCDSRVASLETATPAEVVTAEMPSSRAPEALAPSIDGYRVLRKLGEGGMGAVYLAEDATLGRRVAVKVISSRWAAEDLARARFLREARSMAQVEHPQIVRIYSFQETRDGLHIVMEYVEGESLSERIRRGGPLAIEEALRITARVTEGLAAAFEKGIIHRDIKPSNILIGSRGDVHVADFGLAKSVDTSPGQPALTATDQIVGTPHYLSPEQARYESVDFRADVYALGIVLYEMLAGRPPFSGSSPLAVIVQHLKAPLPPLRERRPDVPIGVARLVERMTDKQPARRPPSYAALLAAIADATEPSVRWLSSPFRGLAPFEFEHAAIFCGRTRAVEGVLGALELHAANGCAFVLVVGMSGSGKSSVVRAGVLPRLVESGAAGRRAVFRPGESPESLMDGLALALLRDEALPELASDGTSVQEIGRLLRENPRGAALLVRGALRQAAVAPRERLVVVVDQMEELFTLTRIDAEERKGFVEALASLGRSGHVWVIGTLRSDFYARCEELPELMGLKEGAGQYHLLPPTSADLAQMIRSPARAAGLRFEEDPVTGVGLDEVLREAALGQVGNLPLLEFALEELYEERTPEGLLTYEAYRRTGGVEGAVARRAESVFTGLPPSVQATLGPVFRSLVHVGSDAQQEFTRKYAALDSFRSPSARTFVDAFLESRLLVADRSSDGGATVSIAHEAMLQSWPRLLECVRQDRELLRVRGRVATAASRWHEEGRPDDRLLAEGKPLEEALPLLETAGIDLSNPERALIEASRRRAKARLRTRFVMNVVSAVLLVATALVQAIFLWKIVPTLAFRMEQRQEELSWLLRVEIYLSNWTVRWSPLLVGLAVTAYVIRRRLRLPEFVRSGMALAAATGIALLLFLLGFLAAMFDAVALIK